MQSSCHLLIKKPYLSFSSELPSNPCLTQKKIALSAATFFSATALYHHYLSHCISAFTFEESSIAIVLIVIGFLIYRCKNKKTHFPRLISDDCLVKLEDGIHFEDLLFLMKREHALGFRLTGAISQTEKEFKVGFYGDSLNLDLTDPGTWSLFMPDDKEESEGFTKREKFILWPEQTTELIREKMIQFWENGISSFLNSSWICLSSAFLLIDYGEGQKYGAYDFHYGSGLGKMGKQQVRPDQIIAIIYPPENSLQREELTQYYKLALVKCIREYAKQGKTLF